jgi:hypothetical protein
LAQEKITVAFCEFCGHWHFDIEWINNVHRFCDESYDPSKNELN